MFVPPCGTSYQENVELKLYYCPATWSRRKAEYLGIYTQRAVRALGRIAKVVACEISEDDGTVVETSEAKVGLTKEEKDRILEACRRATVDGYDLRLGSKFLLCDQMVETKFEKETSGGIMGHRYFDLRKELGGRLPESIEEIAARLRALRWK